ncbi:MAG TPA: cytochrome D ubiquinol oxidase subunit I, partial [Blastocatellia bacterium]|nr:cytochrome D ubiquinol oxidase subunit I [Blastocatellia bacterium]
MQRDITNVDKDKAVEESLDPQDWEELRSLGHRMLDDMLDYLSTLREKPAWQAVPESVETHLKR